MMATVLDQRPGDVHHAGATLCWGYDFGLSAGGGPSACLRITDMLWAVSGLTRGIVGTCVFARPVLCDVCTRGCG